MAAELQFPDPNLEPEFTDGNGQTWKWDGTVWVRLGREPGIGEAPDDGQQYARQSEAWALVSADIWYLGRHAIPPVEDGYGNPIIEGMTYYDTVTHTVYVYDGVEWDAFSGVSEIATLWEYRFDNVNLETAGTTPVVVDVGAGDDHGNVPFDAWVRGTIIVSVYVDGARIIEQRLLTPAGENTNARPQDEETPDVASSLTPNEAAILLLDTTDGITVGDIAIAGDTGVSYRNTDNTDGAPVWVKGGSELDTYDFMVDYDNQTITIISDFTATSKVVIETGTLAASEYIKASQENAEGWQWVSDDFDTRQPGKIPDQPSVYDKFVAFEAQMSALIQASIDNRIGEVFYFAGTTPPAGAMECNASVLHKDTYPKLFAAIGHTWDTFNGAEAPPTTDEFRIPPSSVNGEPLFLAGLTSSNVGDFLANQNKAHRHTNRHSHSGSSGAGGAHTHNMLIRNPYGNISAGDSIDWYRGSKMWYENTGGPANKHELVQSVGDHSHSLAISSADITTSENGGESARPDTAVILMCIWVDQ